MPDADADDFALLAAYRVEPEFDGPPPRDIPAELKVGPFARARRNAVVGFGTAGLICLGLSQVPVMERWGENFLPLGYLDYIGAALIAAGLLAWVYFKLSRGAFEYVRSGEAIAGQILDLEVRPTQHHNGQAVGFRTFAWVRYADPDSGELREAEVRSEQVAALALKLNELTYRVGDVVTLVYHPGKLKKSLTLYGFTGLRGDIGSVPKDKAELGASPLNSALTILGVFAFLFVLLWNVYALDRYRPLDFGAAQAVVAGAGAVVLGLGSLVAGALSARSRRRKLDAENEAARREGRAVRLAARPGRLRRLLFGAVMALGALMLGGLTVLVWAWTLNAWLDAGPATPRPVLVIGRHHTTHHGLFRTYHVEYCFPEEMVAALAQGNNGGKHDHPVGKAELDEFALPFAEAEVSPGALGWPWVRALTPSGKTDPGLFPVPPIPPPEPEPDAIPPERAARWEAEVASIEKRLSAAPDPDGGGVLFTGSSSIRLWDLERSFPQAGTFNAGFGGSEWRDAAHFLPRLLGEREWRGVVLYSGDNDLASGRTPEQVRDDFAELLRRLRRRAGGVPVVVIGVKPSPFRAAQLAKQRLANNLVRAACEADGAATFLDPAPAMLSPDGTTRPELYRADKLHLSDAGYDVWAKLVRAAADARFGPGVLGE